MVLRDLLHEQDRENPPLAEEAGGPLPSSPGPTVASSPRSPGGRAFAISSCSARRGPDPNPASFLFARRDLPFGAIQKLGDQEIPLVLRHMTPRPARRNPLVASKNDYISRLHGRFALASPASLSATRTARTASTSTAVGWTRTLGPARGRLPDDASRRTSPSSNSREGSVPGTAPSAPSRSTAPKPAGTAAASTSAPSTPTRSTRCD